jgi:hypothetical protein
MKLEGVLFDDLDELTVDEAVAALGVSREELKEALVGDELRASGVSTKLKTDGANEAAVEVISKLYRRAFGEGSARTIRRWTQAFADDRRHRYKSAVDEMRRRVVALGRRKPLLKYVKKVEAELKRNEVKLPKGITVAGLALVLQEEEEFLASLPTRRF